jgi:FtsZ-binding cell division protein ZapB
LNLARRAAEVDLQKKFDENAYLRSRLETETMALEAAMTEVEQLAEAKESLTKELDDFATLHTTEVKELSVENRHLKSEVEQFQRHTHGLHSKIDQA